MAAASASGFPPIPNKGRLSRLFSGDEAARASAVIGQNIIRITQRTIIQRQATATDAAGQLIP